jgi:hypothetical protein
MAEKRGRRKRNGLTQPSSSEAQAVPDRQTRSVIDVDQVEPKVLHPISQSARRTTRERERRASASCGTKAIRGQPEQRRKKAKRAGPYTLAR